MPMPNETGLDLQPLFNQARARLTEEWQTEPLVIAAPEAILYIEELLEQLTVLVRIGFLVSVGGERATADTVANPELRALLLSILQAESTTATMASLEQSCARGHER